MSTDTITRVLQRIPTANGRDKTAKLWHDESVLRKLYEQDGRTQKQIAAEVGNFHLLPRNIVADHLCRHDVFDKEPQGASLMACSTR